MRVRQQLSKRLPIHVGQKEVVDALADIDSVAECGLEASLELVAFLEDLAVCVNVERRGGRRLRTCTSLLVIDQPITSTPPIPTYSTIFKACDSLRGDLNGASAAYKWSAAASTSTSSRRCEEGRRGDMRRRLLTRRV